MKTSWYVALLEKAKSLINNILLITNIETHSLAPIFI